MIEERTFPTRNVEGTSIKRNMRVTTKKLHGKKRRFKLILITLIAIGIIGYLIYTGIRDTMTYYLTVSEVIAQDSQLSDKGVRVGGMVHEGSVNWDPKALKLSFVIEDDNTTLPVVYQGVVPDSFKQGEKVIIEGIYADGVFTASAIMPTCPSKYE
jgi:cytochrome c-type biogenesis protein CcmE